MEALTKEDLKDAIREVMDELVLDKVTMLNRRKQTQCVSSHEAMEILGCKKSTFYNKLNDPKCLIRRSATNGKYTLKSIHQEIERCR